MGRARRNEIGRKGKKYGKGMVIDNSFKDSFLIKV